MIKLIKSSREPEKHGPVAAQGGRGLAPSHYLTRGLGASLMDC